MIVPNIFMIYLANQQQLGFLCKRLESGKLCLELQPLGSNIDRITSRFRRPTSSLKSTQKIIIDPPKLRNVSKLRFCLQYSHSFLNIPTWVRENHKLQFSGKIKKCEKAILYQNLFGLKNKKVQIGFVVRGNYVYS